MNQFLNHYSITWIMVLVLIKMYSDQEVLSFLMFLEKQESYFAKECTKYIQKMKKEIIESDLGEFGMFGEQMVPLDFPMPIHQDEDELLDEKKRRKKKRRKILL